MNRIYDLFVCLILSAACTHAQQADTSRVVEPSQSEKIPLVDSTKFSMPGIAVPPFNNMDGIADYKPPFEEKRRRMDFRFSPSNHSFFTSTYSKFIIPAAFISYGLLAQGNKSLMELDISTHHEVSEHIKNRIPYDDYIQFAPALGVYAFDLFGMKARHSFVDRTLVTATSFLLMGATVQSMKSAFGVERPDGSNSASFPSGHTATAFAGAHILFREYVDVSPWIGVGGYAIATATGTMRVLNKKHWVSDVVAGAGVGILSVEAGYLLLPWWHHLFGIKQKRNNLVFVPSIGSHTVEAGLFYRF